MILANYETSPGTWVDAMVLEQWDYDTVATGIWKPFKEKAMEIAPTGRRISVGSLFYGGVEGNVEINGILKALRGRYDRLKKQFFDSQCSVNAIGACGYYFATANAVPDNEPSYTELTDWEALLSTRNILKHFPGYHYNGPEFKFNSHLHRSPAGSYIPTLAKQYLMQVLIPNALLYYKLAGADCKVRWHVDVLKQAISHCMVTGKSEKSVEAWWEYLKSGDANEIADLWNLYVYNISRDGTDVADSRHCYFDKFVSLKCKDNETKFRRGKSQDAVEELLARMEKEPGLKTASKRELVALGVSQRSALKFIKARNLNK